MFLSAVKFYRELPQGVRALIIGALGIMKITEECISCGTCVESCPVGSIVESEPVYAITDTCTECRACVDTCPVDAIVD